MRMKGSVTKLFYYDAALDKSKLPYVVKEWVRQKITGNF